jgi:hypothetical protein
MPQKVHNKANTLTWHRHVSEDKSESSEAYRTQTLLKSHNIGLLVDILLPIGGHTFYDLILGAYEADSFPSEVF